MKRLATAGLACVWLVGTAAGAPAVPDAAQLRRGEEVYARCAGCHAIEGHRTGPQHCGLFGRRAGTAAGFDAYSDAMRRSRIVWTAAELDAFLREPMTRVPGTTMGYSGIASASERADLIAWLRVASDPKGQCSVRR